MTFPVIVLNEIDEINSVFAGAVNMTKVAFFDVNRGRSRTAGPSFAMSNFVDQDIDLTRETSDGIFEGIVGQSAAIRRMLDLVETVAQSDATVLLLGETGTGKELVARAVHHLSRRKDRSLVKLNCAAIPNDLLESELFGHERGAFTGAVVQRMGRFELADHGTLFLDEVGDIPLDLQPKLLRALQEREFERLGSTKTKRVDVRVVAATNCDLDGMVADKKFRSDLYYRLNVFPVRVPTLRERSVDIPLLVGHFTRKYAHRMEKKITTIPGTALGQLMRWRWPGNVRELENLVERAVILTPGTTLMISAPDSPSPDAKHSPAPSSDSVEQELVVRILSRLLDRGDSLRKVGRR